LGPPTTRLLVPVSLILATKAREYIHGLTAFRYDGDAGSAQAHEGLNGWVAIFAAACTRAVADASAFEARSREIENAWRERVGRVRADSSVDLLLRSLPGTPILSVKSAMAILGRSKPQVNDAVKRLEAAGVLKQVTVGRRNRAFEAREVIDAFAGLERQLASPEGDTRVSAPTRRVPARKRGEGA
jgi:hypothetical protein